MSRGLTYAGLGAALATGAPLGWWLLRAAGAPGERWLYAYLLGATGVAFASFGAILGRLSDQLAQRNRELERLTLTDPLTGLANVRAFRERAELEHARAARSGGPLAMVMVDLDHFKRVNDRLGHAAGDAVLAQAARTLRRTVREIDFVARVGGEEFAVLCPGASAPEAAEIAERARAALEREAASFRGEPIPVTASFGVAALAGTAQELMAAADAALYMAKGAGRNRVNVG